MGVALPIGWKVNLSNNLTNLDQIKYMTFFDVVIMQLAIN